MDVLEHALTAASGHVHIEQYHVRASFQDHLRRGLDLVRFAHDLDTIAQLGTDSRTDQGVVVHEEDPYQPAVVHEGPVRGNTISTSVPAP